MFISITIAVFTISIIFYHYANLLFLILILGNQIMFTVKDLVFVWNIRCDNYLFNVYVYTPGLAFVAV
jgi:hypothetical protein